MGRIQNVSPDARTVADLGNRVVMPGQIVEVPDELVINFAVQTDVWAVADDDTAQQLAEQREEQDVAVAAEEQSRQADAHTAQAEEPDGNDSRAAWVAWVTACGLATAEDLEELGRNEIRDQYRTYDRVEVEVLVAEPDPGPVDEPDTQDPGSQDPDPQNPEPQVGDEDTTTTMGETAQQEG